MEGVPDVMAVNASTAISHGAAPDPVPSALNQAWAAAFGQAGLHQTGEDDPDDPFHITDDALGRISQGLLQQGYRRDNIWVLQGDTRKIPDEGWKLHVSAQPEQAAAVAQLLLPELRARGLVHKMAPDLVQYQALKGTQAGKLLTIYPEPGQEAAVARAVAGLLARVPAGGLTSVAGEQALAPGLSARYGVLNGADDFLKGPYGPEKDVRGQAAPVWVPLLDLTAPDTAAPPATVGQTPAGAPSQLSYLTAAQFERRVLALVNASGLVLGRDGQRADVQHDSPLVSSAHARVFRDTGGTLRVADLQSTNGTTIERQGRTLPVQSQQPVALQPGDRVRLGPGGPGFDIPAEPYRPGAGDARFATLVQGLGSSQGFVLGTDATKAALAAPWFHVTEQHARVFRNAAGTLQVADLAGRADTVVERGGQTLPVRPQAPVTLEPGDRIRLGGKMGAVFEVPATLPAPAAAASGQDAPGFDARVAAMAPGQGFTIGRDATRSDLHQPSAQVSGKHAAVYREADGGLRLSDLGSSNGTMVFRGGQSWAVSPDRPVALLPGDRIVLGHDPAASYVVP